VSKGYTGEEEDGEDELAGERGDTELPDIVRHVHAES